MLLLVNTFWNSPEGLAIALRWLTIIGLLLTAAFGAAIYVVNDRISTLQNALISNQGSKITQQDKAGQEQSKKLTQQTTEITRLTTELTVVQERAVALAKKAQDAERGVSDTYDFNGGHRQTVSGRVMLTVGPEAAVFEKIVGLHDEKDWAGLSDACEHQIPLTPRWITPYLFSGIANANLRHFDLATKRLDFVVHHAGSDPNYSIAARILEQIKAATQQ